nr:hypothetical protein [Tanacetum cinerariifolium]
EDTMSPPRLIKETLIIWGEDDQIIDNKLVVWSLLGKLLISLATRSLGLKNLAGESAFSLDKNILSLWIILAFNLARNNSLTYVTVKSNAQWVGIDAAEVAVNEVKTADGACYLELKFHQDQKEMVVGKFFTDTGTIIEMSLLTLYFHKRRDDIQNNEQKDNDMAWQI